MIKVHDNIFSSNLVNLIEQSIFSGQSINGNDLSPKWTFRPNLVSRTLTSKEHGFASVFWDHNGPNTPLSSFYIQPLYEFCISQNIFISSILGGRFFYTSPQINPKTSPPHYDFVSNDGTPLNDIWTLLYYVNDSDGDTIYYKEDKVTELKRVSPKKGRCVFSKNTMLHSAGKPTKEPRVIININFKII